MAFKQDQDFLRFLTMGAAGTRQTARDLASRGHDAVELERYSSANKIWATKIKRLRLPDLMCLRCGRRVEARAKSVLEIKLSHSTTAGREWDASMRDEDLVAFIPCEMSGLSVASMGDPEYFDVHALRSHFDLARFGPPKAASEGAERDLTWPSVVPKKSGTVVEATAERIKARLDSGRHQSYRNRWGSWNVCLPVGATFVGGQRFLATPVRRPTGLDCPGVIWDPVSDLEATDLVDRYSAVKASGRLGLGDAVGPLHGRADDPDEDDRLRLEAFGALSLLEGAPWLARLRSAACDADLARGLQLEAIFILSEIRVPGVGDVLHSLASDRSLSTEARAGAVWGLGRSGVGRPDLVLDFISDEADLVALHAIAAVSDGLSDESLWRLGNGLSAEPRLASAASEVLLRQGHRGIAVLVDVVRSDGGGVARALGALGRAPRDQVMAEAAGRLAPDAFEILEVLWEDAETNWLQMGEVPYELSMLDVQALPSQPNEDQRR